jgi:hypothetical protein
MKLLKDLFYGPGNHYLDLGRVVAFTGVLASIAAAGWNAHLGVPFDLGPSGFLGGLGAVIAAAAALMASKAWERRQAAKSENEATVAAAVADATGERS